LAARSPDTGGKSGRLKRSRTASCGGKERSSGLQKWDGAASSV
jgi:hypothetical protein